MRLLIGFFLALSDFTRCVFDLVFMRPFYLVAGAVNKISLPFQIFDLGWWRHHRTEGIVVLLLIGGAVAGGPICYHRFKHHRLVTNTTAAVAAGDLKAATFAAVALYRADPKDLLACRTLAEISEVQHSPNALAWHMQVLAIDPNDANSRWAAARIDLGNHRLWPALDLLSSTPPALREAPEYHQLLGAALKLEGRYLEAEEHLRKAVAANPQNSAAEFELAKVQLHLPEEREKAVAELEADEDRPELRIECLRELIDDAVRHSEYGQAAELAQTLEKEPSATSADFLRTLSFLHRANSPRFSEFLAECQRRAVDRPRFAADLILWMVDAGLPLIALDWIATLPAKVQKNPEVLFGLGCSRFAASDWYGLELLANQGDWGEYEPLQMAFSAFCERKNGSRSRADRRLEEAFQKAAADPVVSMLLYKMLSGWGVAWKQRIDEFIWRTLEQPSPSPEFLEDIQKRFANAGETQNLRKLAARKMAIDPADRVAQSDFAVCSLLLGQEVKKARKIALSLHQTDDRDLRWALTYSLSLYTERRLQEGLALLQQFSQLDDPTLALYSGIFLAAAGEEPEKAEMLLASAQRAFFLPEELAMADEEKRRLRLLKAKD